MSDERYDDMYKAGADLTAKFDAWIESELAGAGITEPEDIEAAKDGFWDTLH